MRFSILFKVALCCGLGTLPLAAQDLAAAAPVRSDAAGSLTLLPHPEASRYLISGQANIIFQAHAPFHSPYEGPNSLLDRGEYKTSMIGTIYGGFELNPHPRFATDVMLDVESAGGRGISEALGLAGFTNLDVVRNPNLGPTPYLARYEVHQVIGFSDKLMESGRTPFSLQPALPETRLEFWVGRMSLPDLMDLNSIGADSHLQFLNWSVDDNGAWDYAANTRGYTDAAVVAFTARDFTARYAFAAMPTVANGIDLSYDVKTTNGQNGELEWRRGLLPGHKGVVRLLGFVNHANMGNYRVQNQLFLAGGTTAPQITAHPQQSTVKYGVGANFEQQVSANGRVFGRVGWNDGATESYAYTEIDQTFEAGADYSLKGFGRPDDKIGITFVTNAIKQDHQWYLAHGGLGFLLGDGKLNYAREDIVEAYYNYHLWKGVYYALDEQFVAHPGYNGDRGPVMVESVRMHVDF